MLERGSLYTDVHSVSQDGKLSFKQFIEALRLDHSLICTDDAVDLLDKGVCFLKEKENMYMYNLHSQGFSQTCVQFIFTNFRGFLCERICNSTDLSKEKGSHGLDSAIVRRFGLHT